MKPNQTTAEKQRLEEARGSEQQWGTVREDYSESGDAWNYFTHDQARSRAYRWGESGALRSTLGELSVRVTRNIDRHRR